MTKARSLLFWTLAAALLIGHAVLAWNSLTLWRFWEDEAFNLTVPRNLLAGLGYVSDGTLSGSVLTPFDTRISTGPAVLLPVAAALATGIDPVIGARLVPLLYWMLLLAGLGVLGHRIGGRWAALIAIAVPLAFTTSAGNSPIQGPADLLGEIPAAALLVWALVVLPRRAWLAGLLVGLAVQAKLIALLALPAFAVALFFMGTRPRFRSLLRRSWVPLLFVALPTFLFELFAFLSLGLDGFIHHLRALKAFMLSGGQGGPPTTVTQKLATLAESWSLPVWAALVLAAVSVVLIVGGLWVSRGAASGAASGAVAASGAAVSVFLWPAVVGALAFVGWWATASHLPLWVRHPSPGVFAFFPILAAVAIWGAGRMLRRQRLRVVGAVLASVLVILLAWSGTTHAISSAHPHRSPLTAQRPGVAPVAQWVAENDIEWLAAKPWGAAVSAVVLTGAHVGLFDAHAMEGVPRLTGLECETDVIFDGGSYRICAAP